MKNLRSLVLGLILGAAAAYFYFNNSNQPQTLSTPSTPISGIITAQQAKDLSDNWTSLRKAVNDSVAFSDGDNRSSWYSLDDLTRFIETVKTTHPKANGLRFYLGVDTTIGTGGYTTIFMVPTEPNSKTKRNNDISGADGLDDGMAGYPPTAAYPQ